MCIRDRSFTALHWVTEGHDAALKAMGRALRHGGRLYVQLPGAGNIAELVAAAEAVMAKPHWRACFSGFEFPWLFPDPHQYTAMVTAAGLRPLRVELIPRDVVHPDAAALEGWVRTTWMPYTDRLPSPQRDPWIAEVVARYVAERPPDRDGAVHVPSFRLEVEAERP